MPTPFRSELLLRSSHEDIATAIRIEVPSNCPSQVETTADAKHMDVVMRVYSKLVVEITPGFHTIWTSWIVIESIKKKMSLSAEIIKRMQSPSKQLPQVTFTIETNEKQWH